jgi:hypothetical protein
MDHMPALRGKRKAEEGSPLKNDRGVKRSALGNLTNVASEPEMEPGHHPVNKRKAMSPIKNAKRVALGNLNNIGNESESDVGNNQVLKKTNSNISNRHASELIKQINNNMINNNKKAGINKVVVKVVLLIGDGIYCSQYVF